VLVQTRLWRPLRCITPDEPPGWGECHRAALLDSAALPAVAALQWASNNLWPLDPTASAAMQSGRTAVMLILETGAGGARHPQARRLRLTAHI
jgi:hypothetical protein